MHLLIHLLINLLQVEIQVGQDKGKHGIIFKTVKERNWVFVEGLNCVSMSRKKSNVVQTQICVAIFVINRYT